MGAKCCAESRQAGVPTQIDNKDLIKDLPAIDIKGIRDPYEKFEASLPFNRTLLPVMLKQIEDAEVECGEQGYVTLAALRKQLTSSAWQPLADLTSPLSKALTSPAFKNPKKKQSADQIDADWLKVWSVIHCSGKPIDKTNAFFCILQDGGFEKHEEIAAGDKDFEPVFEKICAFSTIDVFKFAKDAGFAEELYSEDECSKLMGSVEALREDKWLEEVFEVQSRLKAELWVQKVSTTANWIFNTADVRKKLFHEAEVTPRHC